MTTDMERLRAAVLTATARDDIGLTDTEADDVVRAVLTSLKKLSVEACEAIGEALKEPRADVDDPRIQEIGTVWYGMNAAIDHILSDGG